MKLHTIWTNISGKIAIDLDKIESIKMQGTNALLRMQSGNEIEIYLSSSNMKAAWDKLLNDLKITLDQPL